MFLFMVLFVSCDSETIHIQDMEGKVVRLTLSSPELTTSRVMSRTEAGTGTENYIDNIRCFFYKSTDGNNVAATYVVPDNIEVKGTYTDTDISVQIPLPSTEYDLLFPEGTTKCRIYVIANLPTGVEITNTDINSLKALEVKAEEFTAEGVKKDGSITFSQPTSFVMDGDATIELKKDALSGNVPLTRSAAKIGLFVNVVKDITDTNGATWESKPTGMLIRIHNGVKNGLIDGLADDGTSTYPNPRDYYTSAPLGDGTRIFVNGNNGYEHHPFYSYPSEWKNSDENETYLELIVPWKKTKNADGTDTSETTFEDCFYQIPINVEGKELLRNTYYKINLTVGMLGSFTPNEPVVLAPSSYVVVNWGTGGVSAKFEKFRYLVVDQNFVEMENVENLSIKFSTSHETEIVNAVLKRPVLNPMNSNDETIASNLYTLETKVVDGQNYIYFSHALDNEWSDTDKNYDYVPYTLELDIRHKDDPNFIEHITIVQYPAMYVVAKQNSAYKAVVTKNNEDRNVFVNSYYSNSSNYNYNNAYITNHHSVANTQLTQEIFGPATGLYKAKFQNDNPNMYVIHATAMSDDKYIIGDPREKDKNNDFIDNTRWAMAPAIYGTTPRKLSNYYRTDVNENTRNMIAPIIRIASSYSVTENVTTRDIAEKRCASYQEDGYPAGRWRMPTYAEVEFICRMSSEGKIPDLFYKPTSSNGFRIYYWCAHGQFSPNYNGGINLGNEAETIRCVYDEWYWTDKCDKGTFTWGDREITW